MLDIQWSLSAPEVTCTLYLTVILARGILLVRNSQVTCVDDLTCHKHLVVSWWLKTCFKACCQFSVTWLFWCCSGRYSGHSTNQAAALWYRRTGKQHSYTPVMLSWCRMNNKLCWHNMRVFVLFSAFVCVTARHSSHFFQRVSRLRSLSDNLTVASRIRQSCLRI